MATRPTGFERPPLPVQPFTNNLIDNRAHRAVVRHMVEPLSTDVNVELARAMAALIRPVEWIYQRQIDDQLYWVMAQWAARLGFVTGKDSEDGECVTDALLVEALSKQVTLGEIMADLFVAFDMPMQHAVVQWLREQAADTAATDL